MNFIPTYDDKNRGKATQRALKMAKLFREDVWQSVMVALDSGTVGYSSFKTILLDAKVGLTQAEVDWLWNYLQHMNDPRPVDKKAHWENPLPEAASTGW